MVTNSGHRSGPGAQSEFDVGLEEGELAVGILRVDAIDDGRVRIPVDGSCAAAELADESTNRMSAYKRFLRTNVAVHTEHREILATIGSRCACGVCKTSVPSMFTAKPVSAVSSINAENGKNFQAQFPYP